MNQMTVCHVLRLMRRRGAGGPTGVVCCAAKTGVDAAPYFRVFNPVTQGLRFDPDGDFVRRWVPELRHLPGAAVHEPWRHPDGYARDYPQPVVDHGIERQEALARWGERGSAA